MAMQFLPEAPGVLFFFPDILLYLIELFRNPEYLFINLVEFSFFCAILLLNRLCLLTENLELELLAKDLLQNRRESETFTREIRITYIDHF